ncbi:MAG TPA: TMEM175 family protein [Thermoplasmata archaeon]|nr:TMEM175 family protein [Thermoplasmata archaeon]
MAAEEMALSLPKARLETLADGVFAISMTLLTIELFIGDVPDNEVWATLANLRTRLIVYAASFILLGIAWLGHHYIFRVIERANFHLLWLNILFLMCVALVPFVADILGRHPLESAALFTYGLVISLVGAFAWGLWEYATRGDRLVRRGLDPELRAFMFRRLAPGPIIGLFAMAMAFFVPAISLVIYIGLPPFYILQSNIDRHFGGMARRRD